MVLGQMGVQQLGDRPLLDKVNMLVQSLFNGGPCFAHIDSFTLFALEGIYDIAGEQ